MLILTEYISPSEDDEGGPLKDKASYKFVQFLRRAGIDEKNVYPVIPLVTTYGRILGNKAASAKGLPEVENNRYLRAEYAKYLDILDRVIEERKPNLILATGALSSSVMLGEHVLDKVRGTVGEGRGGVKTIATYAPRQLHIEAQCWPILMSDLAKAKKENMFPEIRRKHRKIIIEPTLNDIRQYIDQVLSKADWLSIDIETAGDQITCIGFAPTPDEVMVIPFFAHGYPDQAYWPDLNQEIEAWRLVKEICELPVPSIGQNFMYDMTFLWANYKIPVPYFQEDTMLMHHSLQPELRKGLGFISSLHLNEPSWKHMRTANVGTHKDGDE